MTTCPTFRIDIITPNPGEYVASLLDRGLVDDAAAAQSRQYVEGFQAAIACGTVHPFEPAARVAGYEAGQEWLANGDTVDWLPEVAHYSNKDERWLESAAIAGVYLDYEPAE